MAADIKKYSGGSQKTLNEINLSVVLDRIRNGDNVSRSSLSKELNITFPTVSRIITKLLEKKYVIEAGLGKSSGGKKPTILKFNKDRSYVIGIGVDINFIDLMLADLSGESKKNIFKRFEKEKNPNLMIDTIINYINKIIEISEIKKEKVEAVTIGIPAMVEINTGEVKICPTIPEWEGKNLSRILSRETGINVLVDNVTNISLQGERWKGEAQNINNAIFIGIGTGIGAGIMINGKIYRGFDGSAGEIGHMFIDKDLKLENSKRFGQFEFLASDTAIKDILTGKNGNGGSNPDIEEIIRDKKSKEKILELVDNLAIGISNLITVLNPEVVIIKGEIFKADELFDHLKGRVKKLINFKSKIVKTSLDDRAIVIGAVRYAIKYLDKKILSPFFIN